MKRSRNKLIAAWLLLFCFIAGQAIVYSHQHHVLKYSALHHPEHKDSTRPSITETCKLCDVMHHNTMLLQPDQYAFDTPVVLYIHPVIVQNFKSFGLILSDGLSPPLS